MEFNLLSLGTYCVSGTGLGAEYVLMSKVDMVPLVGEEKSYKNTILNCDREQGSVRDSMRGQTKESERDSQKPWY